MSSAILAHENWLDTIGDVPPTQELTTTMKKRVIDIIDRRTTNDNEVVDIDEITNEVIEEYPNIDGFELEGFLKGVIV